MGLAMGWVQMDGSINLVNYGLKFFIGLQQEDPL